MDQFYIESGYYDTGYFVYVADAESTLTAETSISTEAISFNGVVIAIECSAEVAFSISKIVDVGSTLTAEFSQVTYGSKTSDIDLFAFTNAAIAIQVDLIRDNNIAATAVFDIATDGKVYRDLQAEPASLFDFSVITERSRAFNLETQAAFSFDIAVELYKEFNSNSNSSFALITEATITREFDSTSTITASQETAGDRIRYAESALTENIVLTASVRQIRDAHLTAFNSATMTVDAVKNSVAESSLNFTVSVSSIVGFRKSYSSNIRAHSSILVSRYAGTDRPKTIAGTFDADNLINAGTRLTDLSLFPFADNWFFETTIRIAPSANWQIIDNKRIVVIPLGTQYGQSCQLSSTIRYRSSEGVTYETTLKIGSQFVSGTYNTGILNSTSFAQTIQLGVSFTGGQKVSIYAFGTRLTTVNVNTANWIIPNDVSVQFAPDYPFTTNSSTHTAYTDISWLTYGDYANGGATSYTPVTRTNTPETIFLYQFNGNGNESLALTQTAAAAITSASSVSAKLTGDFRFASAISASSTLTATVGTLNDIDLVAFSNAAVASSVNVITENIVNASVQASQATDGNKIVGFDSNTSSEFTSSTASDRIRISSADANIETSLSSEVNQLFGLDARVQSNFFVDRTYYIDGYVEEGYFERLFVSGNLITNIDTDLSSAFSLTADIDYATTGTALVMSAGTMSIEASKIAVFDSQATSTANVSVTADKVVGFNANLVLSTSLFVIGEKSGEIALYAFSDAALVANAIRIRETSSNANVLSTLFFDSSGALNQNGEADLFASSTVDIAYNRIRNTAVVTESIATELVAVVKTTASLADLVSSTSLNTTADKTSGASSNLSSQVSITATVGIVASGVINISSAMVFDATVRELRLEEIYYKIPAEDRTFAFSAETREYTILGETRYRKITQETAQRTIAGETRIYTVD